jgi:hypothetical protein
LSEDPRVAIEEMIRGIGNVTCQYFQKLASYKNNEQRANEIAQISIKQMAVWNIYI